MPCTTASISLCLQTSIRACAPGGRVVLVGMGQEYAKIPSATVAVKEISLMGSFRYANTCEPLLGASLKGFHMETAVSCVCCSIGSIDKLHPLTESSMRYPSHT